jgi:hypothetical protein
MATYKITVIRTAVGALDIIVEAKNLVEAETKALKQARDEVFDTDNTQYEIGSIVKN